MSARHLDKQQLLSESAFAQYCVKRGNPLPKGVLTLLEAKCSENIRVLFSRHYGVIFFTDDHTFAPRSLNDLSRQSTSLPYSVGVVFTMVKGEPKTKPAKVIRTHEEFIKEYFSDLRLIENIDDLIAVLNNG